MEKRTKKMIKKKIKSIIAIICCFAVCQTSVQAAVTPWTNVNGVFYNDKGQVIKGALAKGIDVSHHEGAIDWSKVKQSDITFAIIRCGYGNDDTTQDDRYFKENISGCKEKDITYGIYIYSYATTKAMAKSEASHVLRLIKEADANPTMPIYYDLEDKTQENLSKTKLGDIAETFANEITKAGYKMGVYANLYWWNNKLTDSRFSKWDKWVAQYNSECEYESKYNIWQYTETGAVDGISAKIDVNILLSKECSIEGHQYKIKSVINKATKTENGKATYVCKVCGSEKTDKIYKATSITLDKTSYTYNGKKKKPAVKIKDSKGTKISDKYYTVQYNDNVKPGKATVKVTLKDAYQGSFTKTFTIKPEKVKTVKISNKKSSSFKAKWKKVKYASGYEIVYADNSKFKRSKKVTVKNVSSKTIKTITKGKKHYIKIRAFKKNGTKKIYGPWSSKKTVLK